MPQQYKRERTATEQGRVAQGESDSSILQVKKLRLSGKHPNKQGNEAAEQIAKKKKKSTPFPPTLRVHDKTYLPE